MKFLITAGGTREYIDPVRFISNASSGRMGYALSQAAVGGGHDVVLITSARNLHKPVGVKVVDVETAGEMFGAVKASFEDCDCLIMAAAVSDYTPEKTSETKLKKSGEDLIIRLKPTRDILKWAGENKGKKQIVVGFALEDRNLRENAERKLSEKNIDMIVANRPAAIGARKSTVEIKVVGGEWEVINGQDKSRIAGKIVGMIEQLI